MRNKRQQAILNLIAEQPINTQAGLAKALSARGFAVTQATVSRDMKELGLFKITTPDGATRYAAHRPFTPTSETDKLLSILAHSIVRVDYAMNDVVVKTVTGGASAAAAAIDALQFAEIVGSIAGDDTIIIITRTAEQAQALCRKLETYFAE